MDRGASLAGPAILSVAASGAKTPPDASGQDEEDRQIAELAGRDEALERMVLTLAGEKTDHRAAPAGE